MKFRTDLEDAEIAKGFAPENDLFKRSDLAMRVTGLFDTLEQGSVCLLDGRWGSGKTTFVKQWAAELRSRNIASIYLDAFTSDYIESPFAVIASALIGEARKAKREADPAYKSFLTRAAKVGRMLAATSAKAGLKVATLGALGEAEIKDFSEIGEAIADGLGDIGEEGIKKLLEEHSDREAYFHQLRQSLESLPRLLRPGPGIDTDDESLIVFVDELDRCRPDFALGILETLKHFFRAKRVHFVLVTNADHLQLSVQHRYGIGSASQEYLEKFYDFRVFFDQAGDAYSEQAMSSFILSALPEKLRGNSSEYYDLRQLLLDIAIVARLSLRQVQSFVSNVSISYLAARDGEFRPGFLVAILGLMKTIAPNLYRKAKGSTLTWPEGREFVSGFAWKDGGGDRIVKVLQYYLDDSIDLNDQEWRGWNDSMWRYNITRERVVPYLANSILDRFGTPLQNSKHDN